MKRDVFVLVFGHGRSGTTVCSGLLDMSPDFNMGYEFNNNAIIEKSFKEIDEMKKKLPEKYNGNKIVPHWNLSFNNIIYCINKRIIIIHKNYKYLKIIFVKRNPYSVIMSQQKRLNDKRKIYLSIEKLVNRYIISEKTILRLKKIFPNYHVFDFDKAISCELHRKWLFDFVESKYRHFYSESYVGKKNYVYGSLRKSNAMFGNPDDFPDLKKEIEDGFNKKRFWPWAGANYV